MAVHAGIYEKAQKELSEIDDKLNKARQELKEARELGDLSENSEYDAAKEDISLILRKKEALEKIVNDTVLKIDPSDKIYPGCVIEIDSWGPYREPYGDISGCEKEQEYLKGTLLYGGSTSDRSFIQDKILSEESPIGKFINGKSSGTYEVRVHDGTYMTIKVTKVMHKYDYNEANYELFQVINE